MDKPAMAGTTGKTWGRYGKRGIPAQRNQDKNRKQAEREAQKYGHVLSRFGEAIGHNHRHLEQAVCLLCGCEVSISQYKITGTAHRNPCPGRTEQMKGKPPGARAMGTNIEIVNLIEVGELMSVPMLVKRSGMCPNRVRQALSWALKQKPSIIAVHFEGRDRLYERLPLPQRTESGQELSAPTPPVPQAVQGNVDEAIGLLSRFTLADLGPAAVVVGEAFGKLLHAKELLTVQAQKVCVG